MMTPLAQLDALATWLVNPWLFVAGAGAVALPILIHLLNRRKFRVVDWAAMEFLIQADKKNRRRIRLENLLLLLLRCLAVLLIGLLLARPFIPTNLTAGMLEATQFERIVLLDDSLSMQARVGDESAWELARRRLIELLHRLVEQQGDNSLTLILTSEPNRPPFHATPLTPESTHKITEQIERLAAGDGTANLGDALKEVEDYLTSQPAHLNRIVYLFTDLRGRDWMDGEQDASAPLKALAHLSRLAEGCLVVDAGDEEDRNLAITQIRPEGTLVQGVQSTFDVAVTNYGTSDANDIQVKFTAAGGLPLETTIGRIAARETASVRFYFTFTGDEESTGGATIPSPRKVKVKLATRQPGGNDQLLADSVAYFPARLVSGIRALVVDGDPSAEFGRGESFYLQRALAPQGPVRSGVVATIVSESELESVDLDNYHVIFLLNNDRLGGETAKNIERLEQWVEAGSGLVMMLGDRIDKQFFNDQYWRDGAGLSPLKLLRVRGDESETAWANIRIDDVSHEVFKRFAGQNNPLLDNVKLFGWWQATPSERLGKGVAVVARLSDDEQSPAIAEKTFGKGRVIVFSTPADADWHNWPSDPSYLLMVQDLVRYLAADNRGSGMLTVGEPIREPIDLAQYKPDATLSGPRGLKSNLQATPPARADQAATSQSIWQLEHPAAAAQGFYELELTRRDGKSETRLFAANVDPTEGGLRRVDRHAMERELGGTNVQILSAAEPQALAEAGTQTEIWPYLLGGVIAILASEQLLGWFFGRRRS